MDSDITKWLKRMCPSDRERVASEVAAVLRAHRNAGVHPRILLAGIDDAVTQLMLVDALEDDYDIPW